MHAHPAGRLTGIAHAHTLWRAVEAAQLTCWLVVRDLRSAAEDGGLLFLRGWPFGPCNARGPLLELNGRCECGALKKSC